jgi:protein-S-isoprenylcysteine O-methyltransferase Ste14
MFKGLFKSYVFVEIIGAIVGYLLVLLLTITVVYKNKWYGNPIYITIAVLVCMLILLGLCNSIRDLIRLTSNQKDS